STPATPSGSRFRSPIEPSRRHTDARLTIHYPERFHQRRMQLPSHLEDNEVLLLEARLSRSLDLVPALRETLDDAELARADRFVHEADRARLILGRGLTRRAVSALTGMRPRAVRFTRSGEGKPVVH